jgi:hypothetical protein
MGIMMIIGITASKTSQKVELLNTFDSIKKMHKQAKENINSMDPMNLLVFSFTRKSKTATIKPCKAPNKTMVSNIFFIKLIFQSFCNKGFNISLLISNRWNNHSARNRNFKTFPL